MKIKPKGEFKNWHSVSSDEVKYHKDICIGSFINVRTKVVITKGKNFL